MTATLFTSVTVTDELPIDAAEPGYPIVTSHRVVENTTFITIKIPKPDQPSSGDIHLFNTVLSRVRAVLTQPL